MAGQSEADIGEQARAAPAVDPESGEPGGENATVRAAVVTGTVLALAALVVLYVLVQVWPPAPPPPLGEPATTTAGPSATTAPATTTAPASTTAAGEVSPTTIVVQAAPNPPVRLLWARLQVDREARLFVVVALAGALGGLVYALRSLAWYAGNRNLKYSWMMTYYLQPIVGAGLATITYVVLRGGLVLVTTQSSPDVTNPFGFAAFGALVGLFSSQAAEWLKRVFEQIFAQPMKGKDPAIEVRVVDVQPAQAPAGTEIVIAGTGFADVDTVSFGGVATSDVRKISDTELRVTVPEGAASGPVTVRGPAGTVQGPKPFTVGPLLDQSAEEEGEPPGEEPPPEFDPDEHLEAGLTGLTAEQVATLDQQAAAEHGESRTSEVDDEPLDEDALLLGDAEEGGPQP
jgi:hypothetical protein